MKPKTRLTTQPLRFFLLVPALALVLVGTGQAGSSEPSAPRTAVHLAATQVQCGDMITTDTRLSRDLNNCPADAVIIGAPRVTLDLDGHTIDGVGAGIGVNMTAAATGPTATATPLSVRTSSARRHLDDEMADPLHERGSPEIDR
jgi:hypothetical protein